MSEPEQIADPDVARRISIASTDGGKPGVEVLTVSGELDMLTTDTLTERLDAALKPPNTAVVLDLSGVRFLGSAALSALLKGSEAAKTSGVSFVLVAVDHATLRPFEVTGISSSFTICDSLDAALAAVG